MNLDIINGVFEAFASIMVLNHARVLYNDKMVRGVSIVSVIFFFAWGIWNLYYYPSLGQVFSYWCGMAVAIANAAWAILLAFYSDKKGTCDAEE